MAELMAAPPKAARVRKPRPPPPPPLTSRLDDASGEMLEKTLAMLRKRQKAMRLKPQRVALPAWVASPQGPDSPAVRAERVVAPGTPYYDYELLLLELSDSCLETEPLEIARHSWLLAVCMKDKSMKLVEGVAPSHEEARQRVEACWRIAVNAMVDG